MTILYRVETTTAGGMHEVVAITPIDAAGDGRPAADLCDTELALLRSAVRGHLDLLGHEDGLAVTIVDVDVDAEEARTLSVGQAPLTEEVSRS